MKQPTRADLIRAMMLIKQWHDMAAKNPDPLMFKIYYDHSPEMKFARDVLGPFDEMSTEVIEATSISVQK
jgi:hypothetical protein